MRWWWWWWCWMLDVGYANLSDENVWFLYTCHQRAIALAILSASIFNFRNGAYTRRGVTTSHSQWWRRHLKTQRNSVARWEYCAKLPYKWFINFTANVRSCEWCVCMTLSFVADGNVFAMSINNNNNNGENVAADGSRVVHGSMNK